MMINLRFGSLGRVCSTSFAALHAGALAVLIGATPAPAAAFNAWQQVSGGSVTSGPAVAIQGTENLLVVARATDSSYYSNSGFSLDGGSTWTYLGWFALGGGFQGAPAATSYGSSQQNFAVVGDALDSRPYINVCVSVGGASCSFGGWTQIPGLVVANDLAVVYSAPYLYTFAIVSAPAGTANGYWTRNDVSSGFNSANWSSWSLIPNGVLIAAPAATVLDGSIYVAGAGTDSHYYITHSTNGSSWSSWAQVAPGNSTQFNSAPALTSWSGGHLQVFGAVSHSGANECWSNISSNSGATWGTYTSAGGNLIGAPAAVSPGAGAIQLFGTGTDLPAHHVYQSSNP
jgi:hypothetical protein